MWRWLNKCGFVCDWQRTCLTDRLRAPPVRSPSRPFRRRLRRPCHLYTFERIGMDRSDEPSATVFQIEKQKWQKKRGEKTKIRRQTFGYIVCSRRSRLKTSWNQTQIKIQSYESQKFCWKWFFIDWINKTIFQFSKKIRFFFSKNFYFLFFKIKKRFSKIKNKNLFFLHKN